MQEDPIQDLAAEVFAALERKRGEFRHVAQMDAEEEREVLIDAIAAEIREAVAAGRMKTNSAP
jgi:hypothetical protein